MDEVVTDLRFYACGEAQQLESFSLAGGRCRNVRFPCTVAVFRVNDMWCCVDTGLDPSIHEATASLLGKAYLAAIPMSISEDMSLCSQLAADRIPAQAVRHVFLTHLHADHVGGCRRLSSAVFHAGRDAVNLTSGCCCSSPESHLILPKLLPHRFRENAVLVEDAPRVPLPPEMSPFAEGYDVLGTGAVLAVPLPGHTPGHTGYVLRTAGGRSFFMIGDAAWSMDAVRELRPPSAATGFIHRGGWAAYRETLARLHVLHRRRPSLVFQVPAHDAAVATALVEPARSFVVRACSETGAPDRARTRCCGGGASGHADDAGDADSEPGHFLLVCLRGGLARAIVAELSDRFADAEDPIITLVDADAATLEACRDEAARRHPGALVAAVEAPLHWTAATAAVLLHDTSPDFVIVAGAIDSVSAGGAAARVAALAEANIPDALDVRAMVLVNSGRHCFGRHHASSAPVTEDAPLSRAADLVDGLSRSAREAEVVLQRAFARSLLPCCVVRVGRLVGHDDTALVRTSRAAVRLGLVGPCSEAVETWHHVANVAMTVVAACTMGSDATYGRAYHACSGGDVLAGRALFAMGTGAGAVPRTGRWPLGWLLAWWPLPARLLARLLRDPDVAAVSEWDSFVCSATARLASVEAGIDFSRAPRIAAAGTVASALEAAGAATCDAASLVVPVGEDEPLAKLQSFGVAVRELGTLLLTLVLLLLPTLYALSDDAGDVMAALSKAAAFWAGLQGGGTGWLY